MNDVDTMPRLCGNEPVFMTQHAPAKVGRDDVCAGYKPVFDAMNELFGLPAREGRLEGPSVSLLDEAAARVKRQACSFRK